MKIAKTSINFDSLANFLAFHHISLAFPIILILDMLLQFKSVISALFSRWTAGNFELTATKSTSNTQYVSGFAVVPKLWTFYEIMTLFCTCEVYAKTWRLRGEEVSISAISFSVIDGDAGVGGRVDGRRPGGPLPSQSSTSTHPLSHRPWEKWCSATTDVIKREKLCRQHSGIEHLDVPRLTMCGLQMFQPFSSVDNEVKLSWSMAHCVPDQTGKPVKGC